MTLTPQPYAFYRATTVHQPNHKKKLTLSDLLKDISIITSVPLHDLKSKSRFREVVDARHLYCYFAWFHTTSTLKKIGENIGGRDHSTVSCGRDNISNLLETDKDIQSAVSNIDMVLRMRYKVQNRYGNN